MSQQHESLSILHEFHEPPTIGTVFGEVVFIDTSDTGEGEHIPRSESFVGYDASTQQNVAPVRRSIRQHVLQRAVSPISHPIIRMVTVVEIGSKVPQRNPAPAA